MGSDGAERLALAGVECPKKFSTEPVEALEVEWWGFLAGAACSGGMNSIILSDVFIGQEASGWQRLVAGEIDVVTLWPCRHSGFGHE